MTDTDLRTVLSLNLKQYRVLRNLTQAECAKKFGISIPFLSDIENGKKWVSHYTLSKMANILEIEAYELLKPKEILPDYPVNILEKFSSDINTAFEEILSKLRADYIKNITSK